METEEVLSLPYEELPLKSDKYAAICTEIHLGDRGITHLQGFEKFLCLDTVWLNNNKLEGLEGLETNIRLKCIHLFCNRIRKLEKASFQRFKFLTILSLNDNLLDDFDDTLKVLKNLRNLLGLDLFNNPIAEEEDYRLRVLAALPSLEIFDRHRITPEERIEAERFKERRKKMNKLDFTSTSNTSQKRPSSSSKDLLKQKTAAVKDVLGLLRTHAKDNRCFIETSFLDIDRRHLGIIKEDVFWSILHDYGLEQVLNNSEKEMLMDRYLKTAKVESISVTGTLNLLSVNYLKFCRDLLPISLRIIPDVDAWKTDRVPEVSINTKALEKYVTTIRTQRLSKEIETKKMLMMSMNTNNNFTMVSTKREGPEDGRLDPWEVNELSTAIASIEADSDKLNRKQCEAVFKSMSHRKVPILGLQKALDVLFTNKNSNSDEDKELNDITSQIFRASLGCPQKITTVFVARLARGSSSNANKSTRNLRGIEKENPETEALFKNPIVKWRSLSEIELEALEHKLFEESHHLLENLLRAKKEEVAKVYQETMNLGVKATRLGGQKVKKKFIKDFYSPAETMAAADNRADVLVLPNLKKCASMPYGVFSTLGSRGGSKEDSQSRKLQTNSQSSKHIKHAGTSTP